LLEEQLNDAHTSETVARYEVLNFGVGGYHITQLVEAAKVKVTPFEPDVYMVALTNLSVYRRWHGHIAALMYAGIDLKYDFLKQMIDDTGLTPADPIGVFDARLARYRIPTIRWALEEIKAHAESQGATLMVLLVPTTESPDVLAETFLGVRDVLDELDVPVVNLLQTFAGQDLEKIRVGAGDRHPNGAGHRLLFERLYEALQTDPSLMGIISGQRADARAPVSR
jgi:hypothetical protein